MKLKSSRLAGAAIATIMLTAVLGISQSGAVQSCAQFKDVLDDGEIAIILEKDPIVPKDPSGMLNQIVVCGYGGITVHSCNLCRDSVEKCRAHENDYCQGTIDATINSSLGLSLNWSRTTHSPDMCCKQVCIDGVCKNKCWPC
jgi:hypothetical protein